jgi:hypothetical protein
MATLNMASLCVLESAAARVPGVHHLLDAAPPGPAATAQPGAVAITGPSARRCHYNDTSGAHNTLANAPR